MVGSGAVIYNPKTHFPLGVESAIPSHYVNVSNPSCRWSESLSLLKWSVILSPYEGESHVDPKGTGKGESSDDGHRREVRVS